MNNVHNYKRGYKYKDEFGEERDAVFMPYTGNPDDINMEEVETGIEGFIRWTTPLLDREGVEI